MATTIQKGKAASAGATGAARRGKGASAKARGRRKALLAMTCGRISKATRSGTVAKTMAHAETRIHADNPTRGREISVIGLCSEYSIRRDAFVRLTGFSPRAVATWAQGASPSQPAKQRLTELSRLFDALARVVEAKEIGPWIQRPNAAFDGSTPLQVIERGEADRIWRMIYEMEAGQPD